MKKKKRSFKSLFTKKRRNVLKREYEELDDCYKELEEAYKEAQKLIDELDDEIAIMNNDLYDSAINVRETVFGQMAVLVYRMRVIERDLKELE